MVYGMRNLLRFLSLKYIYLSIVRLKQMRSWSSRNLIVGIGCNLHNIKLGNDVFIGKNTSLYNVELGNNSYINSNCTIRDAKIGSFCSIASNVKIVLGSHPVDLISTHPAFYSNNKGFKTFSDKTHFNEYEKVVVGNDVWIGLNVIIPGGVVIGDGAVIATGSIVTKDVEPYSIVGGIPAKHIKYRFNDEVIKKLLKIKWWNWDSERISSNYMNFLDTDIFINQYYNKK